VLAADEDRVDVDLPDDIPAVEVDPGRSSARSSTSSRTP
jgi:hypothetical protein